MAYDLKTLNHPVMPIELYEARNKIAYREGKTTAERLCPECAGEMTFKHTTGTYRGKTAQRLVYMVCRSNTGNDHGYGPKSRHCDVAYREGASTPDPKPSAPPATNAAPPAGSLDQIIGSIIDAKVGDRLATLETKALDPEAVKTIVGDMIASGELSLGNVVKTLEIKTPTEIFVSEGMRHPVQDEILERCALGERFFLLVGPAGTGKTTIARGVAKALKAKRETLIACSEDIRREAFVGFRAFNVQNGTSPYVPSVLVEDLRLSVAEGAPWVVTTLEEIDASNPNALLTINALENGILPTPDCDEMPTHIRGPNHVVIATANTWGHAGSNQYVGRNQLDAATLDRYRAIFVDYDEKLERAIVGNETAVNMVRDIRAKAGALALRRVVSTRLARRFALDLKLSTNEGKEPSAVLTGLLKNSGWADQEITRVLN